MAAGSRPEKGDNLYYVVLGGDNAADMGVYSGHRYVRTPFVSPSSHERTTSRSPENMALGSFPYLTPIIVVCKSYSDATAVDSLNRALAVIQSNDYRALRDYFLASEAVEAALSKYDRFHAIKVGVQTGIWVNFAW